MQKIINLEYSAVHGTYWIYEGAICSFASVILLSFNYTNSQIGIILAITNILAVILQPVAADFTDRSRRFSIITIIQGIVGLMMLLTFTLFVFKRATLALAVFFIFMLCLHTVLHPLINSLAFKLQESGNHINFGLARACGSLCFAAIAAVLGILVENHGVIVLPITGEITLACLIISLFITRASFNKAKAINECNTEPVHNLREEHVAAQNFFGFISGNKMFFLINLGVIGLYFSNQILSSYMIQIMDAVGGSEADLGKAVSLMAFCEIPGLVFFDRINKRFTTKQILSVAAIASFLKIGLCFMATSVSLIILAQAFQLVSFGLFLPAMVNYIGETMNKENAVKGQALFTTMITIATVLGSFIGGFVLDFGGAKALTLLGTIVTLSGAIVIVILINKNKK